MPTATPVPAELPRRLARLLGSATLIFSWNLPLLIALGEYEAGYAKLSLMQHTGLTIALWDEETRSAIRLILWTHDNPWLFPASAIASNLVLGLTRPGKTLRYLRWPMFAITLALCLWYASLGFHLENKLLGMP